MLCNERAAQPAWHFHWYRYNGWTSHGFENPISLDTDPLSVSVRVSEVARWPSGLLRQSRWTGDRVVLGSNPATLQQLCFGTLAIPFTTLCQCLSEETLKAVGPLVSMPGEVKDPTSNQYAPVGVTCRGLHHPISEATRLHGPHWK